MDLDVVCEEDLGRTPRIVAECDPVSLRLSSREGFLLSRIDGHTSWRLLRQMGGMTPDEVDLCIETWIATRVIEFSGGASPSPAPVRRRAAASPVPGEIDESEIDDSLEIDVAMQRRILDLHSRLGCDYAEILGVAGDADRKTIKKAYRALSRDFHPDRYFRKQIGAHKARLEAIFKKVLEAYELLSDPEIRRELQDAKPDVPVPASPAGRDGQPLPPPSARPLTPVERLRQRMPFRVPESVRSERRDRARAFYDAARTWAENGHHLEAASSIRLAIAFDPGEELYKSALAEIQASGCDAKIASLLRASRGWSDFDELRTGLKQCEEVLLYRPHDPALNEIAARCALGLGEKTLALEHAERSVEHSPDVGRYHRTLACVLEETGARGHAIRELERALELDDNDGEARKLLAMWRPGRVVHGRDE